MQDLQDTIMEHVGKVVHDFYDKKYPDSRGGYGDSVEGNQICDDIAKLLQEPCDDIEEEYNQMVDERNTAEGEKEDIECECSEKDKEIEEMEGQAEWDKMVKQFWYYSEKH